MSRICHTNYGIALIPCLDVYMSIKVWYLGDYVRNVLNQI
jgi:hypothetical protein